MYQIIFKLGSGKEITLCNVNPHQSILDVALDNNIEIESLCGGVGNCKKCSFILCEGEKYLEKPNTLSNEVNFRYACESILKQGSGKLIIELQ